jgi:hypothetical protein
MEVETRAALGVWKEGSWRVRRQRRILAALGESCGSRMAGSM